MQRLISLFALLMPLGIIFSSCLKEDDPNTELKDLLEKQDFNIRLHLENNGITNAVRDDLGLYRQELKSNSDGAKIQEDQYAVIYYKIEQLNGIHITSDTTGIPIKIAYDTDSSRYLPYLLPKALQYMREGEKYRFYAPFNWGYGENSITNLIPHRSIVVVELELIEILDKKENLLQREIEDIEDYLAERSMEADDTLASGVRKKIQRPAPEAAAQPQSGQTVRVNYTGYYLENGNKFDTGSFSFKIDDAVKENRPIRGFEEGVKSMKVGEKSIIYIPSQEGYGKADKIYVLPRKEFNFRDVRTIPPYSSLIFEVELLEIY